MAHVRSTIAKMAQLVREGQHSYAIRNLATRITHDVPSKSPTAEIAAVYRWVRDNIRYRYDPLGLEWVQSPERTVKERAGDCDDMTTLITALCGALGHQWQFRTVGPSPHAQAHVAAQVHDRKRWIDVDPVLEAPQPTTAARPHDLGTFALRAPGADHLWDNGGAMLRGMGAPTTAEDRELWLFAPYFTQIPPYGGDQPPQPGVWPPDTPAYRVLALPRGTLDERQVAAMSGLGGLDYFDPVSGLNGKVLRKLKKVGKKIKKGLAKVPGLKQVAKAVIGIIPGASTIIDTAKGVAQVAKGIKKGVQVAKGIKKAIKGAPKPGTKGKIVAALPKPAARPAPKPAARPAARPAPKLAIARPAPAPKPARPAPSAARYPAGARMRFDANAGVFRVYAPLSGMGAVRPTLMFSIAGLGDATKAKAAISAVSAFVSKNKKPPAIALPAVKAFQASVKLKADGLWGSNTRAAAGHFAPGVALPGVAPAFNKPVTWKAPAGASAGAPAGYKEIATTPVNPGLPPVGAQPGAAAKPPAAAVRVLPEPPPSVEPADLAPEPMPSQVPGDRPVAAKKKPKRPAAIVNAPTPGFVPAGALNPQTGIPPGVGPLPAPPLPAGPFTSQAAYDASRAQMYPGAGGGGETSPWVWVALAYLYAKQKRAA